MDEVLHISRIIFVFIYVLFIPGFSISLLFFGFKKISLMERLALSFALSLTVVPLLTFYANILGFKFTDVLVLLIAFLVSAFGIFTFTFKTVIKEKLKKN